MTYPEQLEFDKRHIWHPYAPLKNPPPVRFVESASGVNLKLKDGSELIDGVASWWSVAHGHNHPQIVEAIRSQASKLSHVMFGGFTHEPAIELAAELTKMTPEGLNKVFFADSGSIAVEVAAKMAVQYQYARGYPAKGKLIALKGGYHGDTCTCMALSDPDGMHTLFRQIMPTHYFGEPDDMGSIEVAFQQHRGEIAGIICEPYFQAANAMRFYSPKFLKQLREFCDKYGLVLIFDEIAAGFYRTGPLWAHSRAEVTPDIMTVGKALTGGHITLAATIASEKIADTISNSSIPAFMHGPTYMANPLACAAGVASLKLFKESDYEKKVNRIGGELKVGLEACREMENVLDVHAEGAVGIVKVRRLPSREDIDRVIDSYGVWLRPFSNFIYTMPPLVSTAEDIARITEAMRALAACPPGPEAAGEFHE